jgi:hypothetical protein
MVEDQARAIAAGEQRRIDGDRLAAKKRQAQALLDGVIARSVHQVQDELATYHCASGSIPIRPSTASTELGIGLSLERPERGDLTLQSWVSYGGELLALRLVDATARTDVAFPATADVLTEDGVAQAIVDAYGTSLTRDRFVERRPSRPERASAHVATDQRQ